MKNKKIFDYDDPTVDYQKYWQSRKYKNASEIIAVRRFLKGKHFNTAVDLGGGYGRLVYVIRKYAKKTILVDSSKHQLKLAKEYLSNYKDVEFKNFKANKLNFNKNSIDLINMIGVIQHLSDPKPEFDELYRVLSDDGYIILEVKNYSNLITKIMDHLDSSRKAIAPTNKKRINSEDSVLMPFIYHNPRVVVRQLVHCGFKVEKILSVYNLKNRTVERLIPLGLMLYFERILQPILGKAYLGPNIFLLVKKAK
jgi:ubiquinone/menaquinone biosynthesis C-methylase UbiE